MELIFFYKYTIFVTFFDNIIFLADPSFTHWSGKCANRLLSTSGLPLLTKQMRVLLCPLGQVLNSWDMRYISFFQVLTEFHALYVHILGLSSVWALLASFQDPLPTPHNDSYGTFEGAFVRDVDSLSWMANNTQKQFSSQTGRPQCWIFFSTSPYGRRNKVPQVAYLLKLFMIFFVVWSFGCTTQYHG